MRVFSIFFILFNSNKTSKPQNVHNTNIHCSGCNMSLKIWSYVKFDILSNKKFKNLLNSKNQDQDEVVKFLNTIWKQPKNILIPTEEHLKFSWL